MRTTVRLDPTLAKKAKQLAIRRGTTLTALIEEGLRLVLARSEAPLGRARVVLPVGPGDGLRPGVALDDGANLRAPNDGYGEREQT